MCDMLVATLKCSSELKQHSKQVALEQTETFSGTGFVCFKGKRNDIIL